MLDAEAPDRPRLPSRLEPHLALGPSVRTLYGDPLGAATLELGLGGATGRFAWAIATDFSLGATAFGVRFEELHQGPYFEYRRDRLRVGGGLNAGFLWLHRVSRDRTAMLLTVVTYPQLSWDLTRLAGAQSIYLVARPALGIFFGDGPQFTFNLFAGIGVRL